MTQTKEKSMKSAHSAELSARLCAVQAYYQMSFNKRPIKDVAREYLDDYAGINLDGERLVEPNAPHFKTVLYGVDERHLELKPIIQANLGKPDEEKQVEPLLNAIFMCGVYELLACQDIDSPIIINDYIEVAKAFYSDSEAKLVNGVLDAVGKLLRS